MGQNSTEVAYGFGQLGSMISTTTATLTPPTGKVFVAITMLADTVFNATNGLVADNNGAAGLEYAGTDDAAHDIALNPDLGESGVGGQAVDDTITFPKGITIYGRWTQVINNDSTPIMLYIGY
jgi:hypothetical protein